jgi:hypothetical protein
MGPSWLRCEAHAEAARKHRKENAMINSDDFSKRYQDHVKTVAQANKRNKTIVFKALMAAKVTRVTAEFDGEGDSGQIDGIEAYAGDTPVTLPRTSVTLHRVQWYNKSLTTDTAALGEAIENFCYDYLEQKHGGWENNEGAHGTFEFDVANRTITLEFNVRFIEITTHTYNF